MDTLIMNFNYRHLGFYVNLILLTHVHAWCKKNKVKLLIPDDYRFGTIKVPTRTIFPQQNYIPSNRLLTKFNTGKPKPENRQLLRDKYPGALFSFDIIDEINTNPPSIYELQESAFDLYYNHWDRNAGSELYPYIGMHVRCGDKIKETKIETPIDLYNKEVVNVCNSYETKFNTVVITDDVSVLPKLVVPGTLCCISKGDGYSVAKQTRSETPEQDLLQLLQEVSLMINARHFIGYWASNVSRFIGLMRGFGNTTFIDYKEPITRIIDVL